MSAATLRALEPIEACETIQCIGVVVQPDPGALARVLEPFAKLGVVPSAVNSRLYAEAGQLVIDIQIPGMAEDQARKIARQIGSFPITLRVVTGPK
jgi:ACT domain-containing protein